MLTYGGWPGCWSRQRAAAVTAARSTQSPIGTTSPDSSATSMNSSGSSRPRVGWSQRTSASKPDVCPLSRADDRLVLQRERLVVHRLVEVGPQREPLDDRGVQVGLVAAPLSLARALRHVEREIGLAQQVLPVGGVGRRADPDAGRARDELPVEDERLAQRGRDAVGDLLDGGRRRGRPRSARRTRRRPAGPRCRACRNTSVSRRATPISSWSPHSWPSVSLTTLKSSRSMNSTPDQVAALRARGRSRPAPARRRAPGWRGR